MDFVSTLYTIFVGACWSSISSKHKKIQIFVDINFFILGFWNLNIIS